MMNSENFTHTRPYMEQLPLPPATPEELPASSAGAGARADASTLITTWNAPSPGATDSTLDGTEASAPPAVGQRLGDFELRGLLGKGRFGTVFLARQVSLDRLVALKVTPDCGAEARALANLEHVHIVRIFSQTVDATRHLWLLCMQYVPGTTLERVLRVLNEQPPQKWSGLSLQAAIDRLSTAPVAWDPAGMRDREVLTGADYVEAVCWWGAGLAEALHHAHHQGVLHRDIKPANILVTPYGRLLLADFGLARNTRQDTAALFGGTLGYMAPEHLDAFDPAIRASWDKVDQRSDLYALGVVLFEMLTGHRPFLGPRPPASVGEVLRVLATESRRGAPRLPWADRPVPHVLEQIVRRCLDPLPERRYQSGAELARALAGSAPLW
jgi:serine/threonine protein kinase